MDHYRVDLFTPGSIGTRQAVRSHDLNVLLDQIREGLIRSMLRGQHTKERLQELTLATVYTNLLMSADHNALQRQLSALRANAPKNTVHVSFYEEKDETTPPDSQVLRDRLFGQLTLAEVNRWSKVPTYVDPFGEVRPRENVTITQDGTTLPFDHALYWSLNGTPDRFWIDNTIAMGASTILEITVPPGIRSEINTIMIVPMPHRACRILSVEYRGSNGYTLAPGFTETENPIKLAFVPGLFDNQIRLALAATTVPLGDASTSVVGIGMIDLALVDYASSGYAYSVVPARGTETFSSLTSFAADYFLDGRVPLAFHAAPPLEFSLQYTGGGEIYNSTTNRFPLTHADPPITIAGAPTTLWLKTTLREPIDRVTPIVRGVTLTYS